MVKEIMLNDTLFHVENFKENIENDLHIIHFDFKVSSEDYHDVTTLLYKGIFDVTVPEKNLTFRGKIQEYSTSVTNLYEKGHVGDFTLCLLEVK